MQHSHAPSFCLVSLFTLALALPSLSACSERGANEIRIEGSEAVRADSAETADGWTVRFDSVVVVLQHPGVIEGYEDGAGEAPAWVREPSVTVWDVAAIDAEGEGEPVLSRLIRATEYDGVIFGVANPGASDYEALPGNVDAAVVTAMTAADRALRVVGEASDGVDTLRFDWMFDLDLRYRCALDEPVTLGAVEIGDEDALVTTIELAAEELLRGEGGELEFAAIAAGDGDGDGAVTREELESAGLLESMDARAKTLAGARGASSCERSEPAVEG
ncbi:hypothetical protein [Pseudenhygromyxa sp. WMMC2535]|uniref:hypothetical protein n=1 Tax=Pseudenhygromyxa sp. WMMC2535 TaxID=2712867 RepID=UPI001552450D|nr:hypothetical protein [Pseudenhygromyxa sp. WMMC2535]